MDSITVALRVEGAENEMDPGFALLELTPELGARLLARLDTYARLHGEDNELLEVAWSGHQLTWISDLDVALVEPRVDDEELLDDDWAVLEDDRLAAIKAALAADPEAEAHVDGPVLEASESLAWRGWSKEGDVRFATPSISRTDLEELIGRLG